MGDTATCDPSTTTCPPANSSQPAKGGLQEQWGLTDPQVSEAGSSEQAKKYTADFRDCMAPVSECLHYTVVHAEKPKHDGMVAKRDECYPVYQAVIPKIDPNDEEKAKNDIEQALAKARGVASEAAQLKADTERAFNAWTAKEPEYDKAVTQIQELEQWEDKAAPALRASATEIRTTANERKYDNAVGMVDQLATTLKPVYDEYLRQKAAKEQYDPKLAALQPRLGQCQESRFKKLESMVTEIATIKTDMEAAAQSKDYVKALELINGLEPKVDAYLKALEELERQKKAYEDALAPLQPTLAEASQSKYKKLEPMQQDMAQVQKDMEASAQAEDFEKALQQCTDLGAKVDAYNNALKELEEKKKKYDEAVEQLKPKLEEAGPKTYARLDAQKKAYESVKGEMETAAGAEDYDLALQKAGDLTAKVDDYLKVVKDLEEKKKQYDEKLEPLKPKLAEVTQSKYAKLQQSQQEIATLQTDMEAAAKEDDYEKALGKLSELTTKVEACSTALKELDEKKKKYDDELGKLKPKLEEAGQKNYEKLAPLKQEFEPVKAQMEAAAQSEDFDQALQRATDLTAKVDAYLAAVKELEAKKTKYEQEYGEFKPRLTEASGSKIPGMEAKQSELRATWQQMDSAAAKGEYDEASNLLVDLKKKAADIPTAPTAGTQNENAGGSGATTSPAVTVQGDPSVAGTGNAPIGPVVAAGVVPFMAAPGTPGGVPLDPSIVGRTPWTPIAGGGAGTGTGAGGGVVGEGGAVLGEGGALVGEGGVVVGEGAAIGAEGGVVAGGAVLGEGALTLGAVATGVATVATGAIFVAAVVVGTKKIMDWASEPPDTDTHPDEKPGDPDNPKYGHGAGGAPEQTPSNPYAKPVGGAINEPQQLPSAGTPPAATDPDAGAPASAPGAPTNGPAVDPNTPPPVQAPSAGNTDPAEAGGKNRDNRRPPAEDMEENEGKNPDGSVRKKGGKHGTFRGGEGKAENDEAFNAVVTELGLDKDEARQLHDIIGGRNLDYHGILQEAEAAFPKKAHSQR